MRLCLPNCFSLRRTRLFLLCLVVSCAVIACDSQKPTATASRPELPALPTLAPAEFDNFIAPVRQQILELQSVLESSPQNSQANKAYANLLHAYSLNQPASIMYQRCQILRPADLDCVYLHGLVLKELGEGQAAIEKLEYLLSRKPTYPRAAVLVAQLYREQGQFAKAIPVYSNALKHDAGNMEARYGLALATFGERDYVRAKHHLNQLHSGNERFGAVHSVLAAVHRQEKNMDEAAFHAAAALQHKDVKISYNDEKLGAVLELRKGDQQYTDQARLYFKAGQLQAAAEQYVLGLEVNSDNDNSHANLAGIYGELGDIDKARMHFDQAVALNSRNVLPFMNLGIVLMKRAQFEEARGLFDQVLIRQPHHSDARTLRAYCGELLGDHSQADEYRQALADNPGSLLASYLLAQQLHKNGNCAEAVPFYEKSILDNSSITVKYHAGLAECYIEQKRFDMARQTINNGLVLAEKFQNFKVEKSLKLVLNELPEN